MRLCLTVCSLAVFTAILFAPMASANERKFSFTYESAVMPKGVRELEYWTTWRDGRQAFYSEFDNRLELEGGLGKNWQTSFYLNWNRVSQEDPLTRQAVTSSDLTGFSSEWKYKCLDPVADPVGLALYGELSQSTNETELETRLILDKRVGENLWAYNLVISPALEYEPGTTNLQGTVENDFGWTHFFDGQWSAGFEAANHNDEAHRVWQDSTLFVGPVASYAHGDWWLTATWLQQLPALRRSRSDTSQKFVLDSHEKVNVRVLASLRLP